MLLASVAEIRGGLGFDEMTDINDAITMALHSAEARLATVLRTRFGRKASTDLFWVVDAQFQPGLPMTRFRLSQGFVDESVPLMVKTAATIAELATGTDRSGVVRLDAERGLVTDLSTWYERALVQIESTAGFAADGSDPDSYELSQVPSWLQEAAKLQALIILETHPVLEEAGIKQDTARLTKILDELLASHIRYEPAALKPL